MDLLYGMGMGMGLLFTLRAACHTPQNPNNCVTRRICRRTALGAWGGLLAYGLAVSG